MDRYTKEQREQKQLADECLEESLKLLLSARLKKAIDITQRARDIYEELEDKHNLAASLNRLSVLYDELGNDSMDLDCLLDAIELCVDEDIYDVGAKAFNNVGSKFMNAKAYDLALHCFELSQDMYDKGVECGMIRGNDGLPFLLVLNINIALIYSEQGKFDKAEKHYLKAKEISVLPESQEFIFIFQASEGLILWKMGRKKEVYNLIDGIMETANTTDYATDYMEIATYLFDLLKAMKDYDRWAAALQIVESRMSRNEGSHVRIEILQKWLDYYYASGDMEKYQTACIMYYELSRDKIAQDFEQKANTIELQGRIRQAARQKRVSDSIVYVDTLTGIGNRNKMLEDSTLHIEESIKTGNAIAIGLIDIDFFKECNDTYGHIEGDTCLKQVAAIISDAVGEYGSVYRYGGDEFLVLMANVDEEDINAVGQKIKDDLDAAAIPNENSAIANHVTVSQGYTKARAEEGDTIEHLVDLADHVLYSVKRYGRNGYKFSDYDEAVAYND